MINKKYKQIIVTSVYVLAVSSFLLSVYFLSSFVKKQMGSEVEPNIKYVDGEIIELNRYIPVINLDTTLIKPYIASNVTIGKNYYDYQSDAKNQEKSLILYENTYIQNSGTDYVAPDVFDIISVLEGTVISVEEDNILGHIVEVRHSNELISVYQSLSEINVKTDDKVTQGQVLGKSGTNNLNQSLGNHLHFEIYYQGKVLNPENCFGKKIEDL